MSERGEKCCEAEQIVEFQHIFRRLGQLLSSISFSEHQQIHAGFNKLSIHGGSKEEIAADEDRSLSGGLIKNDIDLRKQPSRSGILEKKMEEAGIAEDLEKDEEEEEKEASQSDLEMKKSYGNTSSSSLASTNCSWNPSLSQQSNPVDDADPSDAITVQFQEFNMSNNNL